MEVAKRSLWRGTWCALAVLTLAFAAPAARAAFLTHVTVEPEGGVPLVRTLAPDEQLRYRAFAHFDNGTKQDITAVAEWTTSDSRHARVATNPFTDRGLVTARDPGQVEIRAAHLLPGGAKEKGFVLLNVDAGDLVEIITRPTTKKLEVGLPTQFKARAVYENGYQADVTDESNFSSSHPAIASVVNTGVDKGLVTPHQVCPAPCNVVITAVHTPSGLANSDGAITIAARVSHIAFAETSQGETRYVLGRGMRTQLDVYAYRVDGTRTNISDEVTWTPESSPLFTIGVGDEEGGVLTAIADGEATVHAFDAKRSLDTLGTGGARVTISGVLQALQVEPNPFRVGVAEQKTARVKGLLSTGQSTTDLRKFVEWFVGDPSKATLGTGGDIGKVTGNVLGTTTLWAVEPISGIASPAIPLDVRGEILSVSIEPQTATLARGIDYQLKAYANRAGDTRSNITSSANWSATPAGVVQIGPNGRIRGLANGTATIRAVEPVSGKSSGTTGGDAVVTVSGDLVSIEVPFLKVPFIETRKAEAIGHTSTGATTSNLRETVEWTVVDDSIAVVGNAGNPDLEIGEVQPRSSGTTTLVAREPLTGLTSGDVDNLEVQGDIVSVKLEVRNNGLVPVGGISIFKARASLSDGKTANISDKCQWTVDDPSVASVDNQLPDKGTVTGVLFGGTTTVRIDCLGHVDSAQVQIIGNLIEVEVQPAELEGRVLREKQFRAFGHYEGGFELDITRECLWASTDPDVADVDEEGLVVFVAPGEALISATATTGRFGTAEVTVIGGVEGLKLIPSQATMRGSTRRFFRLLGNLDTGQQQSLGSQATWTSSNESVAHMSDRPGDIGIVIAGPETGTATITATLPGGLSASSVITVNHLLVDLWMRREAMNLRVGRRSQPSVRGRFSDGVEGHIARYVQLRTSDPAVVRVVTVPAGTERIEAVAPGTAVISAFDPVSGLETSRNLTVTVVQ